MLREKLKLKARHGATGKPFRETIVGDDLNRKMDRWVKREMIIDRENDLYEEIVTDPQCGEILHHCREPLTQHKGHGAAKQEEPLNPNK